MNPGQKLLSTFKVKDYLTPKIWVYVDEAGVYTLRRDVREKLFLISNEFLEFVDVNLGDCEITTKDCDVQDITITGSIANFNWSKFSDIDLHIVLDLSEIDENTKLVKNILNTKKNLWNNSHDIEIRGFEVEAYTQDVTEPHYSSGVYSVLNNKWIVEPTKEDVSIDNRKILEKSRGWMNLIDELESKYYTEDPQKLLEQIDKLKNKLKKFRGDGLEEGGEFSYENLSFKFLRRSGYLKKLFSLKNRLIDSSLSIR